MSELEPLVSNRKRKKLDHEKVLQKTLECSLVIASKELKAGLYREDGRVFKESISKGIAGKVPESYDQEREGPDSR